MTESKFEGSTIRRTNYYLGRKYPFFMGNNGNLSDKYYLYQVYSPGVDVDQVPFVSLTKVAEKSDFNTSTRGKDIDLISTITYPKKSVEPVEYLSEMLKREQAVFVGQKSPEDFPMLKVQDENVYLEKSLIVGLRNNLRYSNYRIYPGKKVDILWGPNTFLVCSICENETEIWLEPDNLYKNTDLLMRHPLSNNITTEDVGIRLQKSQPKMMASLFYMIKALEKLSFDRRS